VGEPSLHSLLQVVVAQGPPAQRQEAVRLLGILEAKPQDAAARAAARQLADAYLNDPYLERT